MSLSKRAKVDCPSMLRPFREEWTVEYGVIPDGEKALCTLCTEKVVTRTSSVKRHFDTKHAHEIRRSEDRSRYIESKVGNYRSQRLTLGRFLKAPNNTKEASFVLSLHIARNGKPFTDGPYLKDTLLLTCDSLFPI